MENAIIDGLLLLNLSFLMLVRGGYTMTRRNYLRYFIGSLLALILVVGLAIAFILPQERIGPANLERLARGMTKGEMEVILGPPNHGYVAR